MEWLRNEWRTWTSIAPAVRASFGLQALWNLCGLMYLLVLHDRIAGVLAALLILAAVNIIPIIYRALWIQRQQVTALKWAMTQKIGEELAKARRESPNGGEVVIKGDESPNPNKWKQ